MAITRTDLDQTYDADGKLVTERTYEVDVTAETNATTVRDRARQALETNRTYLAIGSPTAAQNLAQIRSLTRQNQALIRLLLGQLDGTD